ncbi:MAG: hypothetical protein IJG00_04565 [Clostridia bacterium]|nr:hypothetical protein [Clostridia bacterium]
MTETMKNYLIQAAAALAIAAISITSYMLIDNKVRRGSVTQFTTPVATETVAADPA